MKGISKPALENVMNDEVKFYPSKFKNTYRHWMENVNDWCISRQLWWGHRIPVYYLPDGSYVVAESMEEAVQLARKKTGNAELGPASLRQDEDVLDTWASSWLWPISVFDGINNPENEDIKYYYPTNDLITAPEIIFFWVARMIIAGYEYRKEKPFKNVYFTGIVRDSQRRKMSKSLGNSPDPLKLIEKYSADGVRVGMLLCSPAGNDLLFDESLTEQGRNFCNKLWNVFRLVKGWETDKDMVQTDAARAAGIWFAHKFNHSVALIDDHFSKFRISDALMVVYTMVRDDFSGWYLEAVKPDYQKALDEKTYAQAIDFLEQIIKVLHPFMPFISEEIYQYIKPRGEKDSIMVAEMPVANIYDTSLIESFEETQEVISAIRKIRQEKNIPVRDMLRLQVSVKPESYKNEFISVIYKLANVSDIGFIEKAEEGAVPFIIKTTEYSVQLGGLIDVEAEIRKLEDELHYHKGFLNSVLKKLSNEKFVNNAPRQVVELEQKKKEDTETRIRALEDQLRTISGRS
jgi:valyl-tRNA synthetase